MSHSWPHDHVQDGPRVQSECSRLFRNQVSVPADPRGFLSRAHTLKTIADDHPLRSVPPFGIESFMVWHAVDDGAPGTSPGTEPRGIVSNGATRHGLNPFRRTLS